MFTAIAGNRFADVMVEWIGQDDETITTIAHRFGWPEGTTRNYRDGETSPTFDRLVELFRLPVRATQGIRPDEGQLLLQALAGERFLVSQVPNDLAVRNARAEDVIAKAVEAGAAWQLLLEDVTSRAVDGHICNKDATSITLVAAKCQEAIGRVVLLAQKCVRRGE